MTAAELFEEMMTRSMAAGRLSDVVLYGALKTITGDAFRTLPAGVAVGLFEALSRNETTGARGRAALALCASLKVAPLDVEPFAFFGAGVWNMAARMVLDAVKREPSAATRTMLIEIVDGLLQDSVALLVDVVNAVPTVAVQDAVSTDVCAEVAGEVPPADEHRAKVLREKRNTLARLIIAFVTACEDAPGAVVSQSLFLDRIGPAFDNLIEVESLDAGPAIRANRDNFATMSHAQRRVLAQQIQTLANT